MLLLLLGKHRGCSGSPEILSYLHMRRTLACLAWMSPTGVHLVGSEGNRCLSLSEAGLLELDSFCLRTMRKNQYLWTAAVPSV